MTFLNIFMSCPGRGAPRSYKSIAMMFPIPLLNPTLTIPPLFATLRRTIVQTTLRVVRSRRALRGRTSEPCQDRKGAALRKVSWVPQVSPA